jgi:hypothetical protein
MLVLFIDTFQDRTLRGECMCLCVFICIPNIIQNTKNQFMSKILRSVPWQLSAPTEQGPSLGLEALIPNLACLPALCLHQGWECQVLASSCRVATDKLTVGSCWAADGGSCDQTVLGWQKGTFTCMEKRQER